MAIATKYIEYTDNNSILEGYFAFDDTQQQPRPTVLIAHAWEGRDEFVCEKAHKLAELGYNGFALDVYGQGVFGNNPEENGRLMQPFLDDRVMLQRRLTAGLQAALELPQVSANEVAVMGYCFGGLCALDLARTGANLKGAVSFHGLLHPPGNTDGNTILAKVLVLHGDKDPLATIDQVVALREELSKADADWQIHFYGSAEHSFTNPQANSPETGLVYNAGADARSWRLLLQFLDEIFI